MGAATTHLLATDVTKKTMVGAPPLVGLTGCGAPPPAPLPPPEQEPDDEDEEDEAAEADTHAHVLVSSGPIPRGENVADPVRFPSGGVEGVLGQSVEHRGGGGGGG